MPTLLNRLVAERAADWIATRRAIHRQPELGFTEFRTAGRVAERLHELGFNVSCGAAVMDAASMRGKPTTETLQACFDTVRGDNVAGAWLEQMHGGLTGVTGELRRGDGPVVALRFDIDALPLAEAGNDAHRPVVEGFVSQTPGVHHACGHDGHTAIGLGVAEWLSHPDANWHGTVRLIFQPAEEGGRGAKTMVEAGVVDDADWFFAAHLGCDLDTGTVAAAAGEMLFSTKFDVNFTGRAAHAAGNPEIGRNALLAGATAILNLHAISRFAGAATRVNVGRMEGGDGRNIIAADCRLEMEVRGETPSAASFMVERAERIIAAAAAMHDVTYDISVVGETMSATHDAVAVDVVKRVAGKTPGVETVLDCASLGGGEDAPFLMRRVQEHGGKACYFLIGSTLADCHHSAHFDFDEASIATGVRLFAGIVAEVTASATAQ